MSYRSDPRKNEPFVDDDEEEEEILGSDDDEQEDPKDYCKGTHVNHVTHLCKVEFICNTLNNEIKDVVSASLKCLVLCLNFRSRN